VPDLHAGPLTSARLLDIFRRFHKSGITCVLYSWSGKNGPHAGFRASLEPRHDERPFGVWRFWPPNSVLKLLDLVRVGLVATVPATPSTLEDYAGRNRGNGIDLTAEIAPERTVTVPVFVWDWYEGRREAVNLASVRLRPEFWARSR
jgi:hypothetical protein